MMDYSITELELSENLKLSRRPVAVTLRETPPPGMHKFAGVEPSGCSFWRIAAAGMTFYTVPSDHYNCAIGSYAHNILLPPDRAGELDQALLLMTNASYIKKEEINSIPQLPQSAKVVVYSPLGDTTIDPDIVICVVRAMQAMILQEAARRAGIRLRLPILGRPTCMSLAAALANEMITSSGCINGRIYTDLGDDELYVLMAGRILPRIVNEIQAISQANSKLSENARERREVYRTASE